MEKQMEETNGSKVETNGREDDPGEQQHKQHQIIITDGATTFRFCCISGTHTLPLQELPDLGAQTTVDVCWNQKDEDGYFT